MYTLCLFVEYDGTDFVGFQIQNNGRSVQQVLQEALSELYKTDIKITGCSRTDSGVHASSHASSLEVPFFIPEENIPHALNSLLPPDVAVKSASYAREGFNARFDSLGKRYIYRLYAAPLRSPLRSRYACHVTYDPDISLMREAGKLLEGEHDFAAYCAAGSSANTTVRRIRSVDVRYSESDPSTIEIEVNGEAFLYNMVRIIAGTLLYVGIGKLTCEDVRDSLISGDRKRCGKTLPAHGLTLEEVFYDPHCFTAD